MNKCWEILKVPCRFLNSLKKALPLENSIYTLNKSTSFISLYYLFEFKYYLRKKQIENEALMHFQCYPVSKVESYFKLAIKNLQSYVTFFGVHAHRDFKKKKKLSKNCTNVVLLKLE